MNIFSALWCAITLGGDIVGWKVFSQGPATFPRRAMQAMFLVCGVIATVNFVHALFPAFPMVKWETTSIDLGIGVGLPLWVWRKVRSWDMRPPSPLAALGWLYVGIPLLDGIATWCLIAGVCQLFSL